MNQVKKLQLFAWALTIAAVLLGVLTWGQSLRWQFGNFSSYSLFPLLGLVAYGIMWAHYMAAAARKLSKIEKQHLKSYFESTSMVVLVCILLHPGLLIYQLHHDGFGLPPKSYLDNYVAHGAAWAAYLGTISLCIFLIYEFHRVYDKKPWWRYIQYASDAAMVFIFIHALRLGRNLGMGWFRVVWWMYGISLLAAIFYMHTGKDRPVVKEDS